MQAYSKLAMCNEPYTKNGRECANNEAAGNAPVTAFPTSTDTDGELRGNLSIWGLWQRQTDAIISVRVTNLDAKSYLSKTVKKCLED
eukprot:2047794-Ditylum_brightwellii.AAC.1